MRIGRVIAIGMAWRQFVIVTAPRVRRQQRRVEWTYRLCLVRIGGCGTSVTGVDTVGEGSVDGNGGYRGRIRREDSTPAPVPNRVPNPGV
jgi:hypothetical protein